MKLSDTFPQHKFFEGICFYHKCKPETNLAVLLFFFIELVTQMTVIDCTRLLTNPQQSKSDLLYWLSQANSFIFIQKNSQFRELDKELYLSLAIILTIILKFVIISVITFGSTAKDWQCYLLCFLSEISKALVLPIFSFQIYFTITSFEKEKYFFMIPGILCCMMNISFIYIAEETSLTISFKKRKKYSRTYYFFASKKTFLLMIISAYAGSQDLNKTESFLGIFAILLINLSDIGLKTRKIVYLNPITSKISNMQNSVLVCFTFLSLVQISTPLLQQSLTLTLITSSVGFYYAQKKVLEYFSFEILIKNPEKLTKSSEAIKYLQIFFFCCQNYKENEQGVMLSALIYEHRRKCVSTTCFCRKETLTRRPIYRDKFLIKQFLLYTIDLIHSKFQKSEDVTLIYLSLKIQDMGHFPTGYQAFKKIIGNSQEKINFLYRKCIFYEIYCMLDSSLSGYKDQFQISQVLDEETFEDKTIQNIKQILSTLGSIYHTLNRAVCKLDLLDAPVLRLYDMLTEVHNKWQIVKKDKKKSLSIYSLFYLYYMKILNVDFEEKYINLTLRKIVRKLGTIKSKDKFQLDFVLFGEHGMVIQSIISAQKMGSIHKVSKNAKKLFQANGLEMKGANIQNFFFQSLRGQYHRMMKRWVRSADSKFFNKTLEAFLLNLNDIVLQVKIIHQIFVNDHEIMLILGMVVINDHDFMVIDKNGMIEGFGKNFTKIFPPQLKGRHFRTICDQWEAIVDSAISTKQKISALLHSYEFSNRTFDARDQSIQDLMEVIGEHSVVFQYFRWSLKQKSVIVIKLLESSKITNQNSMKSLVQLDENFLAPANQKNQPKQEVKPSYILESEKTPESNQDLKFLDQHSRSSNVSQISYSLQKTMKLVFENTLMGKNIKNTQGFNNRLCTLLIFLMFLGIISIQLYVFKGGLQSFENTIRITGNTSTNMQQLELVFNKIIRLYQYCQKQNYDASKCQFLLNSQKKMQDFLHEKIAGDFFLIPQSKSFFNFNYGQYHLNKATISKNQIKVPTSTTYFINFLFFSLEKIEIIIRKKGYPDEQTDYIFKILQQNWQEMIQIEEKSLEWFAMIGKEEIQVLGKWMKVGVSLQILFLSSFLAAMYLHYRSIKKNKKQVLLAFRHIPLSFLQEIKAYYQRLSKKINHENLNQLLQKPFPQLKQTKNIKFSEYHLNTGTKFKGVLILIWLSMLLFSIYRYLNINELFSQSIGIMDTVTKGMASENKIIENYFDLKLYYLGSMKKDYQEFESKILVHLSSNEVLINDYILQYISIFEKDFPEFDKQLSQLIVYDICGLIEQNSSEKCKSRMNYKIMNEGLLMTTNYFHRTTYQGLLQLKKANQNVDEFFKQQLYDDLDNYAIALVKLFQLISKKVQVSVGQVLQKRFMVSLMLEVLEILISLAILIFWMLHFYVQNLHLAQLNGLILCFPKVIIKQNKAVLKIIREYLLN